MEEDDVAVPTNTGNSTIPEASLIDEVGNEAGTDILAELQNLNLDEKPSEKSPDDSFADFTCLDTSTTANGIESSSDLLTGDVNSRLPDNPASNADLLFNLQ